ncbi:Rtdr1 protein [Ectocarpus siliculosus]|uniref:Rtdr1 protein n=1 Tax=Ectocarpus siliculosus TaxID=2880 RepID=D7G0I0_ECTSI|nr:Rtdr1 protein [Ectocarpus siliculosus]|eukprot:CBJ33009.1 Rtdr1 protein [Ectocarpus siliculosus]
MAEVAIENRVYRYEAKPQPTANEPGKIVEAFGLGKCPKLAEQVRSDSLLVRVNTLRVLCEEFKNPTIIAGSVKAGLMSTLPKMALDSDIDTRKFSSKAMVAAARDYNGRTALLKARAPETMFKALDDSSVDVRRNIYEALANASTTGPGTRALVDAGYPARLVDKAVNETEELQPLALRVLCNVTKHRGGLEAALAASLVENLIGLLTEGRPVEVQREASVTLAIACFDDMAKIIAIQNNGVSMLAELVSKAETDVRSAAMGALMMITTVDAGESTSTSPRRTAALTNR